jgi:hypothetical protein
MLLTSVKDAVSNHLALRAMRRYRSRVGWRAAPKYEAYLKQCRAAFNGMTTAVDPPASAAAEEFRRDGVTSLWTPETEALARSIDAALAKREAAGETVWAKAPTGPGWNYAGDMYRDFPEFERLMKGPLGQMLTAYFGTWFKVFHGVLYKTVNKNDGPIGSQRWHSDSGPGTCVNVMYYLHDTDDMSGTLEALPWADSLAIYREETRVIRGLLRETYGTDEVSKLDRLKVMQEFYNKQIAAHFTDRVRHATGKAGLLVPFLNNTLHRGGFPAPGRERRAVVFHFYPSATPTPFDRYRADGIDKRGSYPKSPDF